ncbi:3-deoxy-D-manno-octulosonic acid transferase [Natronohydrobacter thiooxidans]|uniref:3-deoxy-D-manno-octulosonic acid transferase n=1 Tax=Natronohydrobacter thiooxidans TaxID=87172 RepID=UPI0008FF6D97|nr:glycosyltransferase N-terminal domain-containing protein [Natronohydrobacter thiooxidans]
MRNLAGQLYLLSRNRSTSVPAALAQLPQPCLWMHSDDPREAQILVTLSEAVLQKEEGLGVLLTLPRSAAAGLPDLPGRVILPLEGDTPALVQELAAHGYLPAGFLVAATVLPAGMITALSRRNVPVFAIDTDAPGFASGWRHLPGFARAVLACLDHVFLQSPAARGAWLDQGLPADALSLCGRLSATPAALGCNEAERDALAEAFRHRPIWLAVGVPEREEAVILAAHREALRENHRLALILHPADPQRGPELKEIFAAQFITALRSLDDLVTPETQVYIADTEGERGLWYRLATACYLGGSLTGEGALVSPLEPAGLGCAIVHGRVYGRHAEAFDLLREARATRMIQSADALGSAICTALRPERAADQAHRGWQVISSGYEATETVIEALLSAAHTQKGP